MKAQIFEVSRDRKGERAKKDDEGGEEREEKQDALEQSRCTPFERPNEQLCCPSP